MNQTTPLFEFLPYLLSIMSNAVSGRIAQEYRERFALSVPEWRVMAMLGDSGLLTQRDVNELTLMDKVAVNRATKALEERDLVSRRPNVQDGRSHLLELDRARACDARADHTAGACHGAAPLRRADRGREGADPRAARTRAGSVGELDGQDGRNQRYGMNWKAGGLLLGAHALE